MADFDYLRPSSDVEPVVSGEYEDREDALIPETHGERVVNEWRPDSLDDDLGLDLQPFTARELGVDRSTFE